MLLDQNTIRSAQTEIETQARDFMRHQFPGITDQECDDLRAFAFGTFAGDEAAAAAAFCRLPLVLRSSLHDQLGSINAIVAVAFQVAEANVATPAQPGRLAPGVRRRRAKAR